MSAVSLTAKRSDLNDVKQTFLVSNRRLEFKLGAVIVALPDQLWSQRNDYELAIKASKWIRFT